MPFLIAKHDIVGVTRNSLLIIRDDKMQHYSNLREITSQKLFNH